MHTNGELTPLWCLCSSSGGGLPPSTRSYECTLDGARCDGLQGLGLTLHINLANYNHLGAACSIRDTMNRHARARVRAFPIEKHSISTTNCEGLINGAL